LSGERDGVSALRGISSMATRHVLAELAADYERVSGLPVEITAVGGVDALKRVEAGEAFDFVVLASEAIEGLATSGRVDAASKVAIARSGVSMAIAADASPIDIADEIAVRDAALAARSIGYSTGPSGVHLARLFERWGIAETIASRVVQAPPGVPVASLIAQGDVTLGFQQTSELLNQPGVAILGPLPAAIQVTTVFSAAVCAATSQRDATAAALSFFASPSTADVKRRHGMEPGL
jgi:molybdate transport system substrate-binding protein